MFFFCGSAEGYGIAYRNRAAVGLCDTGPSNTLGLSITRITEMPGSHKVGLSAGQHSGQPTHCHIPTHPPLHTITISTTTTHTPRHNPTHTHQHHQSKLISRNRGAIDIGNFRHADVLSTFGGSKKGGGLFKK